ncbi:MAG: acetoin dehydrogenase [Rhodocyclaceae bacterium]|nr:MAG: acetoin dehydrogenase [Rhodocyclaceae bacterium]
MGDTSIKAAVLTQLGQPLTLLSGVTHPQPGKGQVLVKLAYSGVCHSQLMEARGRRGDDPYLPHLLGHEGSGRVVAVGDGVTKVAPGELVILGWIKGSGLDGGGAKYACPRLPQPINAGGVTTFNEYALVSENRIVKLPAGVPLDVAVLFGCAVPTGAGIITHDLQPRPGSTIAIFGLGGIGLSALMATLLYQCASIIAVDVSEEKLALAQSFGAHHVIDARDTDPVAAIRALTSGAGVDYAVEASGQASVIEQAFAAVRRGGGVCVFASHPQHGSRISIDPYELICGKQIRGSWGGSADPDRDVPLFAQLYREGRLPLDKLITKRYTLDQINEALDDLEQHRVTRPLIEIDKGMEVRTAAPTDD